MDIWDLFDIAEQKIELVNPTTPEKIVAAGAAAGLNTTSKVIEFGCGYGEILLLWAKEYGVSGVGIEIRASACQRAEAKLADHSLSEQIKIVCADAAKYQFAPHAFDVAACIGALFIWQNDFRCTLQHLQTAIHENGRLIVAEAYWLTDQVPPEYARQIPAIRTSSELFQICQDEGFIVEWVRRATPEEWDQYESSNWQGVETWLRENPAHPDRQQVLTHLREQQADYFRYGQHYFGWMLLVLSPIRL